MRLAFVIPLCLLATTACADRQAQELACQQRLVATAGAPVGPGGMAQAFAQSRERFERMPREGCSEDQLGVAEAMARTSGRLAAAAERIGDPMRMRPGVDPRTASAFREFQSLLEGYERRRAIQREELARMAAKRR